MIQKTDIIETLSDWNFWNHEHPDTYPRKKYEQHVLEKGLSGEIVILKGVRRCGKSTILINLIKELIRKGTHPKNILFVNLEDPRFINDLSLNLLSQIRDTYLEYLNPDEIPFIFLDEIQTINKFEKWLLKEYELKRARLFVTGSNAKLLSREIGSSLTGRYLDEFIFPLSFQEFLVFKGLSITNPMEIISHRIEINRYFDEYLFFGGFPKIVLTENHLLKKAELRAYFDSILMRDIVTRYRLDNVSSLMGIAVYLMSSIAQALSVNAVKNHFKLSYDLVNRYIEYLENAFLIFRIPLFDWSLKKQQTNPKKIYAIDQGLSNIVSFNVGRRIGDRLENVVFLELLRRGFDIYYYKTKNNYEIDFVVKKNEQIVQLIQVAALLDEPKTKDREIRSLEKASGEIPHAANAELIILTQNIQESIHINNKIITIKDVTAWLLS
ncbi:MAG: ATP-binding protein [Candidatus Magnetomorum sp.]|nr:ATP-binding protein [Candidatus Magnetomorum sp.]